MVCYIFYCNYVKVVPMKSRSTSEWVKSYDIIHQELTSNARAVDPTVLMPLDDIATEQTKATEKTQSDTNQLLDYIGTHQDATIRYHAPDMILYIHSDASYLSV
jgi:hypothetical protein